MRKLALAFLVLLGASSTPVLSAEPPLLIEGSGFSRDEVLRAIASFRKACRPLGDDYYWSELVEVRAETGIEFAPHRLARGWTTGLHLALRVPDRPTRIPTYDDSTGVIGGHTLHYDLGGGQTPGFLSSKRVSQFLCGAPVNQDGKNTFTNVPELGILRGTASKGK